MSSSRKRIISILFLIANSVLQKMLGLVTSCMYFSFVCWLLLSIKRLFYFHKKNDTYVNLFYCSWCHQSFGKRVSAAT
jgi:hypothetical protein